MPRVHVLLGGLALALSAAACGRSCGSSAADRAGSHADSSASDDDQGPLDGSPSDAVDLAVGYQYACAALGDGTVRCWGRCPFPCESTPGGPLGATVKGVFQATQVTAGDNHGCARLRSGNVACWGSNNLGQLGRAAPEDTKDALLVPELERVLEVRAGGSETCARREDGSVWCWGLPPEDRQRAELAKPVQIEGVERAEALFIGPYRSCARAAGGEIRCWEREARPPDYVRRFGKASAVPAWAGALDVDATGCTCVLSREGTVSCDGRGLPGAMLGDGTVPEAPQLPCSIKELKGATRVAARGEFGCAAMADGTAQCWGELPRRGPGGRVDYRGPTPFVLEGVRDVMEIEVGSRFACALTRAGEVFCMGNNSAGEVTGTKTERFVIDPTRVQL